MIYWQIFSIFLKINLLSTSGPASVGILYTEVVNNGLITQSNFVKAVGFANILPGSDAIQLAMLVGYEIGGVWGALVASFASVLPSTLFVVGILYILSRLRGRSWVSSYKEGLKPAVSVMLLYAISQIMPFTSLNWGQILFLIINGILLFYYHWSPILVVFLSSLLGILVF